MRTAKVALPLRIMQFTEPRAKMWEPEIKHDQGKRSSGGMSSPDKSD